MFDRFTIWQHTVCSHVSQPCQCAGLLTQSFMSHCKNILRLYFLQSQRRWISKTVSDTKAGLTQPFHRLWSSIQTKSSNIVGKRAHLISHGRAQMLPVSLERKEKKNQKRHQASFHGFSSSKVFVSHDISRTTWSWLVNICAPHCKHGHWS